MSAPRKTSSQNLESLSRRKFIGTAAVSVGALSFLPGKPAAAKPAAAPQGTGFKLKYAPYLGMFEQHAGKDPIDQLKFISDKGFRAVFDNGLMNRDAAVQEKLAREMDRLKLEWGPFVAYADFKVKSFVTRDHEIRDMLKKKVTAAVETAKRAHVKWALMVPGRFDEGLELD